jgi:hypothetical protein
MPRFNRFLVILLFLSSHLLFAQIPQTMSYQGILTDNAGNIVPDGQVNLTFRLYNTSDEGETLWEETQPVEINSGLFSVILGSLNPLDISFDEPYWLGITVGDETEMSPRTPLTSSPYSLGSTATLVEPESGQGLAIRNSESEPTHKLNADGSGTHTGPMVFLSSIVVGDSVIEVDTTGFGEPGSILKNPETLTSSKIGKNKFYEVSEEKRIGFKGRGSFAGIYGTGGHGVIGESNNSFGSGVIGRTTTNSGLDAGVLGISDGSASGVKGISVKDGIGVWGRGSEAGVYAEGKLKVDHVPNAPDQERVLVWDNDNFVKYRTLTEGGGSIDCATCVDGELQTNAIGVEHGGLGPAVKIDVKNPTYNQSALKIEADQDVANFNMDGVGTQINVGGTNMLAGLLIASKWALECYNNNLAQATAAFANIAGAYALILQGNADFVGNLDVSGNLTKASGTFKIDHPLDPMNKYLYHSFVESPQRMNVYNGNIVLDNNGEAVIELPEYFEALNKDFRYQLTCIGGFAQVYIAEKINGTQFKIAGGNPNLEISWQVTGVRKDAYARSHPLVVEQDKSPVEKGHYLHPEAFGQSKEDGIFYAKNPEAKQKFMEMKSKIPPAKVN